MRGTKCNLVIRQGEAEGYKPLLYIEAAGTGDAGELETNLAEAITSKVSAKYPGVQLKKVDDSSWILDIPDSYKVGHEAHFGQVTEKYLGYLESGNLPEWEIPNMIVKYYITTEGMKKAME